MMPLYDDESISPFKLKSDLVGDFDRIFEIAAGYFGKPSNKSCRWSDPRGPVYAWDWQMDWWLNINYVLGEETINISFRWGEVVLQLRARAIKNSIICACHQEVLGGFDEDEILSSPEWIVSFAEENGHASDRMHTKMVMISYQHPEDPLVKKYFKIAPTTLGDDAFQTLVRSSEEAAFSSRWPRNSSASRSLGQKATFPRGNGTLMPATNIISWRSSIGNGADIPAINITAERMEYPGRRYSGGFPESLPSLSTRSGSLGRIGRRPSSWPIRCGFIF
jgi:hypothetical protein